MSKGARNVRYAEVDRETTRTRVHLVLDLDGGTRCDVATGVATFDDLLHETASYAGLDLGVSVEADVGAHDHLVMEDVGTAFGRAIASALENSDQVESAGSALVPSGSSLVLCAMDLGSRAHLEWEVDFKRDWIAEMATENIKSFFSALVCSSGLSLHFKKLAGDNDRHTTEALFRAFGQALRRAARKMERSNGK